MAASAERKGGSRPARAGSDAPSADLNGDRGAGAPAMMDLEFLRGLIEAVDQSGIDSLEINRAGTRIRIAKTPAPAPVTMSATPQHGSAPAGPQSAPPPTPSGSAAAAVVEAPASAEPKSNLVEVKSPMVGTFYRAPAPEAPAYVEVGSAVSKGQTLCILEAMKLMNELEAEVDGVIKEILANNADPIEYGQVLFRIEPKPTGS
jgi:acetyl-CoA carboxylase biotin carboxyl carrier protein